MFKPFGASKRLAFRAVMIRTGVIPNPLVSTVITHFDMTAQNGGSARLDGFHHTPLCGRHRGAKLRERSFAVAAENIRQFRLLPIHPGRCSDELGGRNALASTGCGSKSSGLVAEHTLVMAILK